MPKKVLIVEDDANIAELLHLYLEKEGFETQVAKDGGKGVELFRSFQPDLVLLDLMLPGLSGQEVLPHLAGIPVIVLSARGDVEEKVRLLLDGAADYLTKPFDTRELLARIAVQLRRPSHAAARLCHGALSLDLQTRAVEAAGRSVRLTRTEFAILKLLLSNPQQVVTKSQLLEHIAADTPDCVESSLKVHVSNLRRKLRDAGAGECIASVWGIGFKLAEEEPKS